MLLSGLLTTGGTKCVYVRIGLFNRFYIVNVRSATTTIGYRYPSDTSNPVIESVLLLNPAFPRFPYGFTVIPWETP